MMTMPFYSHCLNFPLVLSKKNIDHDQTAMTKNVDLPDKGKVAVRLEEVKKSTTGTPSVHEHFPFKRRHLECVRLLVQARYNERNS